MKILKSNISEAYKVQVDCVNDSESDSYDKNEKKEKVSDLVRLHEAMQEKLKTASYSEQIHILILVPEYTIHNILMSLKTLFELHMKWKSRWNISKTCS